MVNEWGTQVLADGLEYAGSHAWHHWKPPIEPYPFFPIIIRLSNPKFAWYKLEFCGPPNGPESVIVDPLDCTLRCLTSDLIMCVQTDRFCESGTSSLLYEAEIFIDGGGERCPWLAQSEWLGIPTVLWSLEPWRDSCRILNRRCLLQLPHEVAKAVILRVTFPFLWGSDAFLVHLGLSLRVPLEY